MAPTQHPAPQQVAAASVLLFTPIDERHRHTGNTRHELNGVLQGPVAGLAICPEGNGSGYYLFGCNAAWEVVTDTWHASVEEAMNQAEFEYGGVSATWQRPE
jgi:hypothetical protein